MGNLSIELDGSPDGGFPARDRMEQICPRAIGAALQLVQCDGRPWALNLIVTDDREIQEINLEHRKKDAPTDVLSFPAFDLVSVGTLENGASLAEFQDPFQPEGELFLGDLIISWETCNEQAARIGHTPEDEFFRLFVHGLLHLIGFDHERSPEEEREMFAVEDRILAQLS